MIKKLTPFKLGRRLVFDGSFKVIIKVLSYIFIFICLVYLLHALIKLNVDFKMLLSPGVIKYISPAVAIVVFNLFLASYVYKQNIQLFSLSRTPYWLVAKIYVESNIGKYLPGNFMHFAGRNIIGGLFGLSQKKLLVSTIFLLLQTIFAALLIGFFLNIQGIIKTMLFCYDNYNTYLYLFFVVMIVFAFMVTMFVWGSDVKFKKRLMLEFIHKKNIKIIIANVFFMVGYLFFYAISFYIVLLINAAHLDVAIIPAVITGFIIAWLLGTIVPGAPGGLGVREAVLFFWLSNYIIKEELALSIFYHRVATILADIVAFFLVRLLLPTKQ